MYHNANDAYFESRILSADPVELVCLLYQGAIDAVREARRHLASGDIAERTRAINRALDIIAELTGSLDRERGGDIAVRMAALYEYLYGGLVEANLQQKDEPLSEALGLLTTLAEAWAGIRQQQTQPAPAAANAWATVIPPETTSSSSHAWSF